MAEQGFSERAAARAMVVVAVVVLLLLLVMLVLALPRLPPCRNWMLQWFEEYPN